METMLLETSHVWNTAARVSSCENVWSLNPWHFESRFPAAKCVFELENKLSGERDRTVDTMVSPSPEFALVDKQQSSTRWYDTIAWYEVVRTDAALCQLSTYLE